MKSVIKKSFVLLIALVITFVPVLAVPDSTSSSGYGKGWFNDFQWQPLGTGYGDGGNTYPTHLAYWESAPAPHLVEITYTDGGTNKALHIQKQSDSNCLVYLYKEGDTAITSSNSGMTFRFDALFADLAVGEEIVFRASDDNHFPDLASVYNQGSMYFLKVNSAPVQPISQNTWYNLAFSIYYQNGEQKFNVYLNGEQKGAAGVIPDWNEISSYSAGHILNTNAAATSSNVWVDNYAVYTGLAVDEIVTPPELGEITAAPAASYASRYGWFDNFNDKSIGSGFGTGRIEMWPTRLDYWGDDNSPAPNLAEIAYTNESGGDKALHIKKESTEGLGVYYWNPLDTSGDNWGSRVPNFQNGGIIRFHIWFGELAADEGYQFRLRDGGGQFSTLFDVKNNGAGYFLQYNYIDNSQNITQNITAIEPGVWYDFAISVYYANAAQKFDVFINGEKKLSDKSMQNELTSFGAVYFYNGSSAINSEIWIDNFGIYPQKAFTTSLEDTLVNAKGNPIWVAASYSNDTDYVGKCVFLALIKDGDGKIKQISAGDERDASFGSVLSDNLQINVPDDADASYKAEIYLLDLKGTLKPLAEKLIRQ